MSHLSLESNRKHANSGFQLRQVQHGSASGVEAPLFDSPKGVTAQGPRGSLCSEPPRPARAGRRSGQDLWVDLAASWMGRVRCCSPACLSRKELTTHIIHPSSVLSVQIRSQGVLEQHRTYHGKAAGILGSLSAPWDDRPSGGVKQHQSWAFRTPGLGSLTAFSSQCVPKDTNPTLAAMTEPSLLPPGCIYTGICCNSTLGFQHTHGDPKNQFESSTRPSPTRILSGQSINPDCLLHLCAFLALLFSKHQIFD